MSLVLLGDSIFKRLYIEYYNLFSELSGIFCISGITVKELYFLVKKNHNLLKSKCVVLMIGTNDILNQNELIEVKTFLKVLIRYLIRLSVKLYLCDLIPIPAIFHSSIQVDSLKLYNSFIRSFQGVFCTILHTYDYFTYNSKDYFFLYCQYYGRSKRIDMIHPNSHGLLVLKLFILNSCQWFLEYPYFPSYYLHFWTFSVTKFYVLIYPMFWSRR